MEIRSITYFCHPGAPLNAQVIHQAGEFIRAARRLVDESGFSMQTTRLATVPFPEYLPVDNPPQLIRSAQQLERAAGEQGFAYLALGPALPEIPASYSVIPDVLAATYNTFLSGVIANPQGGISLSAIQTCAEIISKLSTHDPNGFGNLYFAALANVPAGAPFFPAAYHDSAEPAFAFALQAADLAVQAFRSAASLDEARRSLVTAVQQHAARLSQVGESLERQFGVHFRGLDFTLAPFPQEAHSIGAALEALGLPAFGLPGSLAASAFLTECLERAVYQRTGFNGLMLPVLEDAVLAQRAAQGTFSLNELLLYSAVCGTGLDTIPLPGDSSPAQLEGVLLDLAALALRLDKPLTARLMPIPGKAAGDPTGFDFPYFANSRVMHLPALPLGGLWQSQSVLSLNSRRK